METFEFIIEIIIGVGAVISMLGIGIYIGREHGTFEKFILKILKKIENNLKPKP